MTELTQSEQIKRLQQQVDSLSLNVHRLAEILNAIANQQVVASKFENDELTVTLINETEPIAAIDRANL